VDEVLVFPREALVAALRRGRLATCASAAVRFARGLRGRRFDLVIDFHSILRSALLSRASGAPRRVAYDRPFGRELAWLFATDRARVEPRPLSRFERNAAMLRCLGVDAPPAEAPFAVDPRLRRQVALALGDGPAPIAIHPGTSDATAHKRWAPEAYAQVARALARDGLPSIVTRGPARSDRAAAEAVVAASAGAARLAPETPTLAALAALFASSRLYLGGDTGPMHVASLVGTPVVQILGPTDPVENAPWTGTPSRSVRVPLVCSPCRRGCAAATCMRSVAPAAVIAAARELLASGAPGRRPAAASGAGS
jgi:ADP-heptose:LPS heptosyltransferase